MFGTDEVKYEDIITRIQSLPKGELKARYSDAGAAATSYLLSTLKYWRNSNAQYDDSGAVLAQLHGNALAAYLGLQVSNEELEALEPWQVCDHFGVRSNFDLILAIERSPFLDDEMVLADAKSKIGHSAFWAVAICYLSSPANANGLIHAYISFSEALRAENFFKHVKLAESVKQMSKAYEEQEERRRRFVRKADLHKAQLLRKKTDQYRARHPKYSRDYIAKELAKDKTIGLGVTRIKEYFGIWFTLEQWPRSRTGPKPTNTLR